MTIPNKPKVYVETSTISFLMSRPSRNILISAKQELTREWWKQRERYELFVSTTVIEEIEKGDPQAIKARSNVIPEFFILKTTIPLNC